mgnify:CR=1 FL=1
MTETEFVLYICVINQNREKMQKKSLYEKEELMQLSKEFLVSTILRLEQDKNYWFNMSQEIMQQRRKDMEEMWNIIDKK